jgi:hypothetical protein
LILAPLVGLRDLLDCADVVVQIVSSFEYRAKTTRTKAIQELELFM